MGSDEPRLVVAAKVRIPPSDAHVVVRLDALMSRLWGRRLGLLVAPAGSGKTTLLARFAASSRVPVAWYRCESWDVTPDHLLRHLDEAFAAAFGRPRRNWDTVETAIADLETSPGRTLLVIDDAHCIVGTPAERELERFIDYAPPALLIVMASRAQPGFNLSRLRVSGALAEISGDDLRLRSWEVEDLFRDYYREPLPPVELAELARRTEGWAAGLKLFHLATSGKALDERRRVLRALGGGSRLVREYLTRNVLDDLPPALREFLLATSVLGRLSGPICDLMLDRSDSAELLQELERRQIFTTTVDGDGDFRYHEVLRSHLEHMLASQAGERELRTRYSRAGRVLERFGAIPESLYAFCRAEDWAALERLLGRNGAHLAGRVGIWLDALPAAVLEHDPWLLLASARRHRAEGRWQSAVDTYQRAEKNFDGVEAAQICQRERLNLAAWLTPSPGPALDKAGLLRLATIRDPLAISKQLASQVSGTGSLAGGLASLLAGELDDAARLLGRAVENGGPDDSAAVAARVALALVGLLAGTAGAAEQLEKATEEADERGLGFVARIGRACGALTGRLPEADAVRVACEHIGDQWGVALAELFHGWGCLDGIEQNAASAPILEAAAGRFHTLGAPVLEAWCRALHCYALARRLDPAAVAAALRAEALANAAAVEGPKLFVYSALALADAWHRAQFSTLAQALLERSGFDARMVEVCLGSRPQAAALGLSIRCFGEFRVLINAKPFDMGRLKPRVRALLRRLCVDAGSAVHREALQDSLWPEADADVANRNLQVAISSLRQALEPGVARGASSLLVREGDSYRLVLPPGSQVDLADFEHALQRCHRARLSGNLDQALDALQEAAAISEQQLMPEDGSAGWVVERRDRIREGVVDAGRDLARRLVAGRQPSAAAQACLCALRADRYDDASWKLLIEAREILGDEAGVRRAQAEYRRIVSELEVEPTGSSRTPLR